MPRIVNNRICYANHNVVLDPSVHASRPDYILELEDVLSKEGGPTTHREELDNYTSIPCYAIEMPTVVIGLDTNLPLTRMMVTVTLFNGNQDKLLCQAHCARSEGFLPLYGAMHQRGIDIGQAARREAEKEYFKLYDAYVAETESK